MLFVFVCLFVFNLVLFWFWGLWWGCLGGFDGFVWDFVVIWGSFVWVVGGVVCCFVVVVWVFFT